jgi:hypothetical protein
MAFCAPHVRMIHAYTLQSILTEWCLMNFVFAQVCHKPRPSDGLWMSWPSVSEEVRRLFLGKEVQGVEEAQ